MGVDEAFSIVGNEQNRLLAMLNRGRAHCAKEPRQRERASR
ncbi:hypothetical protein NKH43_34705 [Mesorhizobium sp. M1163]